MKQAELLPVERARELILEGFPAPTAEVVPLAAALGRVLAETMESHVAVPPFANSSMDGFAIRSTDTDAAGGDNEVRLAVVGTIAAGEVTASTVVPGTCCRIMTGAPLPLGADAVIPFEDVQDLGESIGIDVHVPAGASVRQAGQDIQPGDVLLQSGTELHAAQIGLLAATGNARVAVARRPRVLILATGDELASPGEALKPGQIYNSNAPMLAAAVTEAGGAPDVIDRVGDDRNDLRVAMEQAAGYDLLLTSGGASVGDWDYVKDILTEGGNVNFWRVRMRPGKPLIFGSFLGVPVIGLPGNPTSALVTFEEFARPAIRRLLGAATMRPALPVTVRERIDNRGGRRTYARVCFQRRSDGWEAILAGSQDSAMLGTLAQADGLLEISEERETVLPGEQGMAQVWRLPDEE